MFRIWKQNKLVLQFDYAPTGLMATNKTPTGFYVSGDKEEWLPADAKLKTTKSFSPIKHSKSGICQIWFGNTLIGNVFSKEVASYPFPNR
jgi:hypothetical protein